MIEKIKWVAFAISVSFAATLSFAQKFRIGHL
jgi:hypothetical protein